MKTLNSPPAKIYLAVMVIIGWFALVSQFYMMASLKQTAFAEMVIRYFSFFTIQSNFIVAVVFTFLLLYPSGSWARFFARQQTLTAVTLYIIIVGLIYNTILRFIWSPQGLQRIVDELLHAVVPVLAAVYWLVFVPKNQLQWKSVWPWLIYPFVYIIYILIRGSISGFYPYPFINSDNLGINKVLVNSVGIAIVFTVVALVLVAVGKSLAKSQVQQA